MTVLDHPIIADRLARLRDKDCSSQHFRLLVGNVARLMVPQVTSDLAAEPCEVETPLELMKGARLARQIVLVPILRAGLSLSDGFLDLIPEAVVVHLGLARNEKTLEPETYYQNVKFDFTEAHVLVLDPMLATGGSAAEALRQLKAQGATRLKFVCLIASPEGVECLEKEHPDVPLYTAAVDRGLNELGYIYPGLGDAGDRSFGTM
ncbi:MAG: uracil phosphoribosyltransferase [Akkermansiaceae bacterium]